LADVDGVKVPGPEWSMAIPVSFSTMVEVEGELEKYLTALSERQA
jgi:hypothetical protein